MLKEFQLRDIRILRHAQLTVDMPSYVLTQVDSTSSHREEVAAKGALKCARSRGILGTFEHKRVWIS